MQHKEPIFNVPASVLGILAVLGALHAVRAFMPPYDEAWFVLTLALIPARLTGHANEIPGGDPAIVTSFLTHMLVHADLVHLGVNAISLLAFGSAIAKRNGGARFLAFALTCGLCGAAAFILLNWGLASPVVGASGAISGLMGGTFRLMFSATDTGGIWRLREAPQTIPLMPLPVALGDRRVLLAIGIFCGINVLALYGVGGPGTSSGIAWEAHIGGFLAGLFLMGFFERPGNGEPATPADGRFEDEAGEGLPGSGASEGRGGTDVR